MGINPQDPNSEIFWAMMEFFIGFLLLVAVVYWLYQGLTSQRSPKNNTDSPSFSSPPDTEDSLSAETHPRNLIISEHHKYDERYKYDLERRAEQFRLYIQENTLDKDSEGFARARGSVDGKFNILQRDNRKNYRGRVKVVNDFFIAVKYAGPRGTSEIVDLRNVDEIH